MRNYMKEIQKETEMIEELIKEKEMLLDQLCSLSGDKVIPRLTFVRLEEIEIELDYHKIRRDILIEKYRFDHPDYFRPMDEIDIRISIGKDGSIRGRLL